MVETIDLNKELSKYDLLIGGYGPSVEYAGLTEPETQLLDKFIERKIKAYSIRCPEIADVFSYHRDMLYVLAGVFKAKTDGKTFGGELPSSGKFGIKDLQPSDIKYDTNVPTDYSNTNWILNLTAGQPVYFLGSSTDFFKASSTTGKRTLIVIFQNGVIEYGTSPKIDKMQAYTEKVNYPPFSIDILVDKPLDRFNMLYMYETPFSIIAWYDFGVKFLGEPEYSGTSDVRLLGVVFYEYDYFKSL